MAYIFRQTDERLKPGIIQRPDIGQLQQEAQQAETEASKGFGRRFLGALPGGIAETLLQTPARFLKSTLEAPETILRGGAEPTTTQKITSRIPYIGKQETFQEQILKRPENLQGTTLGDVWSVAQVPLAGLETGVLAVGAYKGVKAGVQATRQLFTKTAEKRALKDVLEVILPKKMTPTTLEERVKTGGVAYKGYITKTAEPVASKFENEVANTVKGIVSPKYTPDKNISLIKNKIGDISENFVKPNLESYPGIFNENTILSKLRVIKPPTLLKSNTTLNNTYEVVTDATMNTIKGQPHTMSGLWKARQVLDDIADEARLLEPAQRAVAAKAVRDVRNVMNQFIIDTIPEGQKLYGAPLKEMSKMYKAIDMIADNTPSKIVAHPALKTSLRWFGKIAKYTAAGIGIGWLAKRFGSGGWDAGL